MATCNQSFSRRSNCLKPGPNYIFPTLSSTPILRSCPQANGIVTSVVTMSPKNPNSAISHVANINLSNGLRLTARLPGKGYLCAKYNRVLVEGGRANDLPGVGYTAVSGVYDFSPVVGNSKSSSVYGVSRPNGFSNHIRRSVRN